MKKNYLIPEVELFEVQAATLLAESIEIKEGELDKETGDPIGDPRGVNDFVFEW